MKKYADYIVLIVILGLVLVFSPRVKAVEFEISAGHSVYKPSNNGIWWQSGPGLDYHFETKSNSIMLGMTDYATESIRWHAGYSNLGSTTSWAIATPDADYTGTGCRADPCASYDTYIGTGSVEGFYLTFAPEYKYKEVKFFVEAGAWVYLARFNATVTGSQYNQSHTEVYHNMNKKDDWQIGPVIGFGIEYRKTQLVFSAWRVDSTGDWDVMIPNYIEYTTNFSVRHIF